MDSDTIEGLGEERSAGSVLYRMTEEGPLYLLVYSARNGSWGFPKGHIESGESERQAAEREIIEETGIRPAAWETDFREEICYPAVGRRPPNCGKPVAKHAVYLLARAGGEEVRVDNAEITDFQWVRPDLAESLLAFDSLKLVLRRADKILHGR